MNWNSNTNELQFFWYIACHCSGEKWLKNTPGFNQCCSLYLWIQVIPMWAKAIHSKRVHYPSQKYAQSRGTWGTYGLMVCWLVAKKGSPFFVPGDVHTSGQFIWVAFVICKGRGFLCKVKKSMTNLWKSVVDYSTDGRWESTNSSS